MGRGDQNNPMEKIARLRAEVDRLRADLADARHRFEAIYDLCDEAMTINGLVEVRLIRAALSAGGGGPAEGGGSE